MLVSACVHVCVCVHVAWSTYGYPPPPQYTHTHTQCTPTLPLCIVQDEGTFHLQKIGKSALTALGSKLAGTNIL